jgi:hypothetical protein
LLLVSAVSNLHLANPQTRHLFTSDMMSSIWSPLAGK